MRLHGSHSGLWFDVEKKYKTIGLDYYLEKLRLWFDVEKKYKTMFGSRGTPR